MNSKRISLIVVLFALAALPPLASAAVVYSYTGNPYNRFEFEGTVPPSPYDSSMSVSASFVIDEPVGPNRPVAPNFLSPITSWSVFDGTITLDNSNTTSIAFSLGTDASGAITSWYFFATSDPLVAPGETYHQIASAFGAAPNPLVGDLGNTAICNVFSSAGACTNNDRNTAYADLPGTWTVSPVPLPGAVWLFGSAIAAIGLLRRRRSA